ncbi:uncharacterized protein EMH_0069820 [Eimeria mitis]|uniref:Uncharacterized protein n=1 Tax=Eimeria mitis TaxID=44415 RepID=U6K491_9EIME|nr:uncharacterized protein EMH_0069820 [Eimeria mitis]CDJ31796.1 hypothetical protein EMH_0069820 [Eimeria mitis]
MKGIAVQKREGEVHPPPPKIPRLSESWASDAHSQMSAGAYPPHPSEMAVGGAASALDADAWVEEESELVSVEAVDKLYTTNQEGKPGPQHDVSTTLWRHTPLSVGETHISPPSSFAFGRAHSGDDTTTPEAWLVGSSANSDEQDLQQRVVSTVARHPTVETSSVASTSARSLQTSSKPGRGGAGSMPRADVGQDRQVQSTEMDAAQQLQQPAGGTNVSLDALEGSLSATAVRGTSSGGREPCMSKDIREHPFVRLPVVNPEDIPRNFRELVFLPCDIQADSPMEAYMVNRNIILLCGCQW